MVISSPAVSAGEPTLFLPASVRFSPGKGAKNCFFELFSNFDAITRDSEISSGISSRVSFSNFTGQNRVLRLS